MPRTLNPIIARPPGRTIVKRRRRRVPGGTSRVCATRSSLIPRRLKASTRWPRLMRAIAANSRCCSEQPPQSAACWQTGSTRSGPGVTRSTIFAAQPSPRFSPGTATTVSPGAVPGINSGPDGPWATPSPRAPMLSIVTVTGGAATRLFVLLRLGRTGKRLLISKMGQIYWLLPRSHPYSPIQLRMTGAESRILIHD